MRVHAAVEAPWEEPLLLTDVLSAADAQYLIELGERLGLRKSGVIGSSPTGEYDRDRTSENAWLTHEDPVAGMLVQRAAALAKVTHSG